MTDPVAVELVRLEQGTASGLGASRFSPLVSWLVGTTNAPVVVEIGPGDEDSLGATCEAVGRSEDGRFCAAVLLPSGSTDCTDRFRTLSDELERRFGPAYRSYETEEAGLSALADEPVALVHLSLFDSDDIAMPDLDAWHEAMAPGAVVVVTTTASGTSVAFAEVKRRVMDSFPSVTISLGLTTEAVVAQRPEGDATPIVDMLRKAPFAVGAFLALIGEQMELQHLLADEPEPSEAVRALIGRVIDQQHAERAAFLAAFRVYKEESARLSTELVEARSELVQQTEAARLEREHLVAEFLDRVDELAAKVSTTASRYSAELADKEALLEAEGRKVEAYAGQAAVAQSVIDDMRQSTSWRLTAPVRLLSRMLARKAQSSGLPQH